jgi:hypothetical protein
MLSDSRGFRLLPIGAVPRREPKRWRLSEEPTNSKPALVSRGTGPDEFVPRRSDSVGLGLRYGEEQAHERAVNYTTNRLALIRTDPAPAERARSRDSTHSAIFSCR